MSSTGSGWYPDPSGRFEQRFFDGNQWTAHVARGDQRLLDAPPARVVTPIATMAPTYGGPIQVQLVAGNGMATAALVLGIFGVLISFTILFFFVAFPIAVLAFIFGLLGRSRANSTPANVGGGKAITGIILGVIGVAVGETITGTLWFTVSDGAKPITLVWDPFGAAPTRIPLTQ